MPNIYCVYWRGVIPWFIPSKQFYVLRSNLSTHSDASLSKNIARKIRQKKIFINSFSLASFFLEKIHVMDRMFSVLSFLLFKVRLLVCLVIGVIICSSFLEWPQYSKINFIFFLAVVSKYGLVDKHDQTMVKSKTRKFQY